MGSATSIGVDYYLSAGQSGVGMGATEDNLTCRIDVQNQVLIK